MNDEMMLRLDRDLPSAKLREDLAPLEEALRLDRDLPSAKLPSAGPFTRTRCGWNAISHRLN